MEPRPMKITPVPIPVPLAMTRPNRTTRAEDERKKSRLVVPLTKSRDYVPGSGPALQPLNLLPPRDSSAYIVDRIFLPPSGLASDGKPLPKRMTYIVAWRDLPAARLLVPAMDVLDYVSPLALEEWEWEMELSLEQDRAELEEEKHETKTTGQKKRGRPPVHCQIEAAAVAEPEAESPKMKRGAMSLSTPKKTRMEEFEGLSEDNESPSRQLQEDVLRAPSLCIGDSDGAESEGNSEREEDRIRKSKEQRAAWASVFKAAPNAIDLTRGDSEPAIGPKQLGGVSSETTSSGLKKSGAKSSTKSSTKTPKKKSKSKSKTPQPKQDDHPDAAWEVKRIEGFDVFEVEDRGLVRYFKVRWEGDWPPDQNPSWEPEENLPPNLVRNFFKLSKDRIRGFEQQARKEPFGIPAKTAKAAKAAVGSNKTNKRKRKTSPRQVDLAWRPGKQFRSVSDAFAGDVGDVILIDDEPIPDKQAELQKDGEADELFIVEDAPRTPVQARGGSRFVVPPTFGLF